MKDHDVHWADSTVVHLRVDGVPLCGQQTEVCPHCLAAWHGLQAQQRPRQLTLMERGLLALIGHRLAPNQVAVMIRRPVAAVQAFLRAASRVRRRATKPTATCPKPPEPPAAETNVLSAIDGLWALYKASPTDELRNRLIEYYQPTVRSIAHKVAVTLPNVVQVDELISAGTLGLIDSIRTFDPGRGIKFTSYCPRRIRGAMLDELRATDWVPRLQRSRLKKLHLALERLTALLGRRPTVDEIAQDLAATPEHVFGLLADSDQDVASLFRRLCEGESNDQHAIDVLINPRAEDPQRAARQRDVMRSVMRGLSRDERLILVLYYYEQLPMSQIAATLNCSESRISQRHTALMARLRKNLEEHREELFSHAG